jgi:asparagine synthase (glutamine-hydrolysing)
VCGISGFCSAAPRERAVLQAMNASLRHRGPDDTAVWLSDGRASDGWTTNSGTVGLAQRRLAILDLSPAGRNPMSNDDGTLWITYNGEVYNFRELRNELEGAGFRFRSRTDSEVILKAYERWGSECVQRFVGMFAFAIWDRRRASLFLVRDRLGIKPLYYLQGRDEIAFASELKALRLYPAFDASIDRMALGQFLRFQYVPSPASIYRAVRKLPPGHWLEWRDGSTRVERYWDPIRLAQEEEFREPEEEIGERFEALLSEAVRYRMISDVPLGAFLSGGVDSSTIVSLMQENTGTPVRTFTIGFETPQFDESSEARAVARHLGTVHHEQICTTRDAIDLIPILPRHFDEPFGDSSAIPTMLVSRFARGHVTVVLSGDGGDELFWGYNRYQAYQRLDRLMRAPAWIRHLVAGSLSLAPDRRARHAAEWLRMPQEEHDHYLRFVSGLSPRDVVRLSGVAAEPPVLYEDARRRLGESRPDAVSVRDLVSYLPEDILTKVDRASMAFSLEARVPLLDHRLVEFSLRLPLALKYRNGRSKYLLRRSLYRRVPPPLIERSKKGFAVPLARWFAGELRDSLRSVLSPGEISRAGLVDPDAVRDLLGKNLRNVGRRPDAIWSLYVLHLWAAETPSQSTASVRAGVASAARCG